MKKAVLFLSAALCVAGNAYANGIETFFSNFSEPQPQQSVAPAKRAKPVGQASLKAVCKEVEVAVDEGYGVSGHETRIVCAPDP